MNEHVWKFLDFVHTFVQFFLWSNCQVYLESFFILEYPGQIILSYCQLIFSIHIAQLVCQFSGLIPGMFRVISYNRECNHAAATYHVFWTSCLSADLNLMDTTGRFSRRYCHLFTSLNENSIQKHQKRAKVILSACNF